jgi:hypothetical protein
VPLVPTDPPEVVPLEVPPLEVLELFEVPELFVVLKPPGPLVLELALVAAAPVLANSFVTV